MEQPTESRTVLPGEEVAVVEEYEPGEGTYEDGGRVYAAQPGRLRLDPTHRVARVSPFNPPAQMQIGDVVYGVVNNIRGSMCEAQVLAIHGRDRQVAGEQSASLHISKISGAYVEDIRDVYRLGDIVRARVIQTDPSLQVTTAEGNLGVVLALCTNCRGRMAMEDGQMRCPLCDRTERRKATADYGTLELVAPIPVSPEEGVEGQRPRGGEDRGRGRPRDRGRGGGRGGDRRGRRGGRGGRDGGRDSRPRRGGDRGRSRDRR